LISIYIKSVIKDSDPKSRKNITWQNIKSIFCCFLKTSKFKSPRHILGIP
jgi:hypothetical protein